MNKINETKKTLKSGSQSVNKVFANQKAFREYYKLGNAEAKRRWKAAIEGNDNALNVEGRKLATDNPIGRISYAASGRTANIQVVLPKAMQVSSGRAPGKVARLENELAQAIARSKAIEDKFNKLLESINLGEAAA